MVLADSLTKEEKVRALQRVLSVFASTQEDGIEEYDVWAGAVSTDRTWDDAENAFRKAMKGTGT